MIFFSRKKWITAINRLDLLGKKSFGEPRLCGNHFSAEMFKNEDRNRLFNFAVPAINLQEGIYCFSLKLNTTNRVFFQKKVRQYNILITQLIVLMNQNPNVSNQKFL